MTKPDPGSGRGSPTKEKKAKRSSKPATGRASKLLDEVLRRAYLAIYKAVSDGLPAPSNPGLADAGKPSMKEWRESKNVARLLSEREAQAAADLAGWILDAAVDAILQAKIQDAEQQQFLNDQVAKELFAITKRYKFKNVTKGRKRGTQNNSENAVEASLAWKQLIKAMHDRHGGGTQQQIYDRIVDKHGTELKAARQFRKFSTVRRWM